MPDCIEFEGGEIKGLGKGKRLRLLPQVKRLISRSV
jgi:hypothetical protein